MYQNCPIPKWTKMHGPFWCIWIYVTKQYVSNSSCTKNMVRLQRDHSAAVWKTRTNTQFSDVSRKNLMCLCQPIQHQSEVLLSIFGHIYTSSFLYYVAFLFYNYSKRDCTFASAVCHLRSKKISRFHFSPPATIATLASPRRRNSKHRLLYLPILYRKSVYSDTLPCCLQCIW